MPKKKTTTKPFAKAYNPYEVADRKIEIIKLFKNTKGKFAGKPFNLQDWQINDILRPLYKTDNSGNRIVKEAFIFIPRKNGKALAVNTPMLTTDGWKTIGSIMVGDYVFRPNGNKVKVIAVSDTFTGNDCYRVTFADGRTVIADAAHIWEFYDQWRERKILVTTEEAANNYIIGSRSSHIERRYSVGIPLACNLKQKELPLDPYILGAWLGDGTSSRGEITTCDKEMEKYFTEKGFPTSYRYTRGKASTLGLPGLVRKLKDLGVLNNKHIPENYFISSIEQRRLLLAGLLDTDGGVIGIKRHKRVEFCSTKETLAQGVLWLARSLGYKSTLKQDRARLKGKDCGPRYRVSFCAFKECTPFLLKRKTNRLISRPLGAYRIRSDSIKVIEIKKVKSVPTKCIEVAHRDGMYLCGRDLIPTHNSEITAAIALEHLLFEPEEGIEVILGASDKDQASIVYRACQEMVSKDKHLLKRCKLLPATKIITKPGTNHFLKAIPSDEGGAHGLNPSLAIGDELHAWRGRGLYDAIRTGQGARDNPLLINITTAGYDKHSVCYERYDYAKKVLQGIIKDPTFLPVLYEAGEGDDWRDEKIWIKANPGLRGKTPFRNINEMRRMAKEAEHIPELQNTFRRLYLNQWTEQETRWIDVSAWDKGNDPVPELNGRRCHAALDLSSTTDLTALCYLFEPGEDGRLDIFIRYFVPSEGARRRSERDKVPYLQWIKDGFMQATDGDVVDQDYIRAAINEDAKQFNIVDIAIDRWNATQITTQLQSDGFDVVPFGQGMHSMAAPSKAFEGYVISGAYRHGGNPVLRWNISNLAAETDAAENVKPSKKRSKERIDGAVALIMATGLYTAFKTQPKSRWESDDAVLPLL